MKIKLFIFVFFFGALIAKGQDTVTTNSLETYKSYFLKNPNYAYVYVYVTKAAKEQEFYQYFLCDSVFKVVYENLVNKVEKEKSLKNDILFSYLDSNWTLIKKMHKKYFEPNFKKQFMDKTKTVVQVGIRYNDLHFNHFLPKKETEISKIKNEDIKNGYRVINQIVEFFEKTF